MSEDARIASLEAQIRTLRRMVPGVLGLIAAGGLLAASSMQSVPDLVQAKTFEVVNDAGKVFVRVSGSTTRPNSASRFSKGE